MLFIVLLQGVNSKTVNISHITQYVTTVSQCCDTCGLQVSKEYKCGTFVSFEC